MRVAIALLLLTSLAYADTVKQSLAKGRKLANQKKYAAALAVFEAGLKDAPDDPTLASEAGLAAYLAKEYGKAELLTRKSLAGQGTPSIRGASLYNLGLILEARADKKGAIEAYKQSLAARPHRVVRAALAKLDPAAAAAADSLVPATFDGPFASIAEYCKGRPLDTDAGEADCTCGDKATDVGGKLIAPLQQLQKFARGCNSGSFAGHVETLVAAKLPAGWYVFSVVDGLDSFKCSSVVALDAAIIIDTTLLIPLEHSGECSHGTETGVDASSFHESDVVAIGVGPSKVPSASTIELLHDEEGDSPSLIKLDIKATWRSGTELLLAGKIKGIDQPDLIGQHTLVFP